jgi:hypothetical protein
MLLSAEEIRMAVTGEDGVNEHAIQLAFEALLLAFCDVVPKASRYHPLDPFSLQKNARILRNILRPPSSTQSRREDYLTPYSVWGFRKEYLEPVLSGAPRVRSPDLAVAGNGYVAYTPALANWDGEKADPRAILTLHIAPGPVKADQVEGKLAKLTEGHKNAAIAGRIIDPWDKLVNLFQGDQCRLDEMDAKCGGVCKVVHLWRTDTAGVRKRYTLPPISKYPLSKVPLFSF